MPPPRPPVRRVFSTRCWPIRWSRWCWWSRSFTSSSFVRNRSGFTRLMLAAGLVVASVILLLPSFKLPLPAYFDTMPKIQLGLDLQGGTHLLLEVKLQDAINNALKRRAEDLSHAMTDSKLEPPIVSQKPDGSVVVKLKNPTERTAFLSLIDKSFPDIVL